MDEFNLDELISKYPHGSSRLENEINSLKRKREQTDTSVENGTTVSSLQKKQTLTKSGFTSVECGKCFTKKQYINRHLTTRSKIKFLYCNSVFSRLDSRERQVHAQHSQSLRLQECTMEFSCIHCRNTFKAYDALCQHILKEHPLKQNQKGGQRVAFKNGNDLTMIRALQRGRTKMKQRSAALLITVSETT